MVSCRRPEHSRASPERTSTLQQCSVTVNVLMLCTHRTQLPGGRYPSTRLAAASSPATQACRVVRYRSMEPFQCLAVMAGIDAGASARSITAGRLLLGREPPPAETWIRQGVYRVPDTHPRPRPRRSYVY